MATLVVGGDGNVDELGGGVGVAEGDDGDVDVGGLLDGLGVGAGVGDDDETGLLEGAGDVVGEVTGGETTGNGGGTGVGCELEAINEAEAGAERLEERYWRAELHRLRGVFLTAIGAEEAQIEASFSAAIRIAREQKSISLERRAEGTLAEYRRQKTSAAAGRGFRLRSGNLLSRLGFR